MGLNTKRVDQQVIYVGKELAADTKYIYKNVVFDFENHPEKSWTAFLLIWYMTNIVSAYKTVLSWIIFQRLIIV